MPFTIVPEPEASHGAVVEHWRVGPQPASSTRGTLAGVPRCFGSAQNFHDGAAAEGGPLAGALPERSGFNGSLSKEA